MTEYLGNLIWWKVVDDIGLDHHRLTELLAGTDIGVPAAPIPIDVFRRLSNVKRTFPLSNDESTRERSGVLECTLATVESRNPSMLVRHMVGTVKRDGMVRSIDRIGDVAFYKPPRGKHSKARMRIVVGKQHQEAAQQYAGLLRETYERGVKGALDSQAVRRVVRGYLAEHGAVYLDGPYFCEQESVIQALSTLFSSIEEGGSHMHTVPLVDTPAQRAFIDRHREDAA